MTLGSLRYDIRINRSADDVWARVTDAGALHTWFPGLTGCDMNGNIRVIHLGSGLSMPEEILVNDATMRRFQYRVTAPLFKHHRGTIDVVDLHDGTCVVTYSTEADPRTMALTIAGGTAGALEELKRQMEA